MSTRAQQIGIWIIAVVMTVGTIGGFFAIVLANQNQATQQTKQQELVAEYTKQQEEAAKQNAENSEPLEGYGPETFDAAGVTSLQSEVLVEGTGETVKKTDTISANYFGWLSDGTIFDSSNKKDADDTAISFSLTQVIQGWADGLDGQKVGNIVKLTIPADLAYGTAGSGVIPANAPLQFIVKINAIETATES